MPTYLFLNTETNEEFEQFMSISEMTKFLEENKHITQLVNGAPAIGDVVRLGLKKPDNAFRDLLRNTKKEHSRGLTRSTVNTF